MKKSDRPNDRVCPEDLGFPSKIGDFVINPVSWNDFPAKSPQATWFLAYTYWVSNYKIHFVTRNNIPCKFRVVFTTSISPKSWRREQGQSLELLQHEYGHYLINCVMGLDFRLRANKFGRTCQKQEEFNSFCEKLFNQKRKQYQDKQKEYDKDSYHYLDRKGQQKWEKWMKQQILSYARSQRQFEEESKRIEKQEEIRQKAIKPIDKTNTRVNSSSQADKKDFSIRKVEKPVNKPNNRAPSLVKKVIKPLNNMKIIQNLYREQQL